MCSSCIIQRQRDAWYLTSTQRYLFQLISTNTLRKLFVLTSHSDRNTIGMLKLISISILYLTLFLSSHSLYWFLPINSSIAFQIFFIHFYILICFSLKVCNYSENYSINRVTLNNNGKFVDKLYSQIFPCHPCRTIFSWILIRSKAYASSGWYLD